MSKSNLRNTLMAIQPLSFPIPKYLHLQDHNRRLSHSLIKRPNSITSPSNTWTCFSLTDIHRKELVSKRKNDSYPSQKTAILEDLHSSSNDKRIRNQSDKEGREKKVKKVKHIFSNMWWADVKAALGQRINVEGILSSIAVVARDRHLALPHVSVADIRYINWEQLRKAGFRGVVFDKDNTLTIPYSLTLWDPLRPSLDHCRSVFGNSVAVFSNSAGLIEYDHDDRRARALERTIGLKVLRHKVKKPAGTAEEIENHFGCEASKLVMVGDRPFTDVVFGNRNGFLTILTEPLNSVEEPFTVKLVRKLERALVKICSKRGLKAPTHRLIRDDDLKCVKDPPGM
ncbi:phosphatidylglycerophosphate phosphatase 1, chloroplastic/mitochondrial isoform X1 [Impatiens glandulifera]|uniref:phosphatidylglycerophosphate phosphatase 1, chloroplastic/mitochondrial isoform X1 n=1 Tax=Impatiens glandulifera TaxID=253017 RepID=UPI001FB0E9D5|nr:phosphatidylglycerophosphate phosphatase 1, chloroplastic/mitochondrial isoform X1 [Impatiens glandulifera]